MLSSAFKILIGQSGPKCLTCKFSGIKMHTCISWRCASTWCRLQLWKERPWLISNDFVKALSPGIFGLSLCSSCATSLQVDSSRVKIYQTPISPVYRVRNKNGYMQSFPVPDSNLEAFEVICIQRSLHLL